MDSLSETIKTLYHEFPRNWRYIQCSEATYRRLRAGASVILPAPEYKRIEYIEIFSNRYTQENVLQFFNRRHEFVKQVKFDNSSDETLCEGEMR